MKKLSLAEIANQNVNRFIVFKALFNARFYYPVFAVIFLDFGLTLDQFALLNVIWAVTIILAEIPSGALSDLIGRKKLLILTTTLMVLEMSVWAFAPIANPTLLFWVLAINRVLSGLAEATASGSDEALVYESLEKAGLKDQWSAVLQKVSRWQSVAFMLTMITGGLVYDPVFINKISAFFNFDLILEKTNTLRNPLYLTLFTSILCWINSFGFIESQTAGNNEKISIFGAFKQTFKTARWIVATPFALVLILAGSFADSVIRMFVTLGSEYYRLIQYPEFAFGIIGSCISIMNFILAPIAKNLVDKHSPTFIFALISITGTICFSGVSFFIPYIGLIFSLILFSAFFITTFTLSFYLNHITDQSIRATVLSFKGLAMNIGYGVMGILYAELLIFISKTKSIPAGADMLFMEGSKYFAPYFIIGSAVVFIFTKFYCPNINKIASDAKSMKKD